MVGRCYLAYYATDDNVLECLAFRTEHQGDMLLEQSIPLIDIGLVTTDLTAVFLLP